jgi:hypothetical protein
LQHLRKQQQQQPLLLVVAACAAVAAVPYSGTSQPAHVQTQFKSSNYEMNLKIHQSNINKTNEMHKTLNMCDKTM